MDITSIAASGLLAGEARLSASAANVANAQSDGAIGTGGPAAYAPVRVDQVSLGSGGTSSTTQAVTPATVQRYDPSARYANGNGLVAAPNVDPITETLQQSAGLAQFQLSAKAFSAGDTLVKALLDIKG